MSDLPPFQTHSSTSLGGAGRPGKLKLIAQEKWVYETLQRTSLADYQLWEFARHFPFFDQLSSLRRARIGLLWVSRSVGATPYHPVEDSSRTVINPESDVPCVIWQIKPIYRGMPYDRWLETYKPLARQRHGRWNGVLA